MFVLFVQSIIITQPSIRTLRVIQYTFGRVRRVHCAVYRCQRIGTLTAHRVVVIEFVRHRGARDAR